ncbi:DUF5675 family protein [Kalamiella sp. sgz302252]|uniref:DUF5675 family protein n=1 Tax=Pantoea sp. sgz302252 TaxID=3341827 RepID=UPI0036D3576C
MAGQILVKRIWQTELSTISRYNIPGTKISGYMLERPGPDTTTPNKRLRIPEGTYSLKWHATGKGSIKEFSPLPLLYNSAVPVTRYVLIHNGNQPKHTDGCLLIGGSKSVDFVGNSVNKLKELKAFLQKNGIENYKVIISSQYQ